MGAGLGEVELLEMGQTTDVDDLRSGAVCALVDEDGKVDVKVC